jgi:hypothetical protein
MSDPAGAAPAVDDGFFGRVFEVFNPAGSVGISVDGRGYVCGISLDADALTSDEELAAEIVTLAGLARAKFRMELRLHSLAAIRARGGDPLSADRFYRGVQGLPTEQEYAQMESAVMARYQR